MGNLYAKDIQFKALQKVNLYKVWNKCSKNDDMSQQEFDKFISMLSGILNVKIDPKEIESIFRNLQTTGTVSFQVFNSSFENWCNKQVQEIDGTEVLKPSIPMSNLTREYDHKVPYNRMAYKKIEFKNPQSAPKRLKIFSSNEEVLIIRTQYLEIPGKESRFIKFKIIAKNNCQVYISITHAGSGIVEETLSLKLAIEERPRTPERSNSGNLNKNKAWGYVPKRPSPRRNSISDEEKIS